MTFAFSCQNNKQKDKISRVLKLDLPKNIVERTNPKTEGQIFKFVFSENKEKKIIEQILNSNLFVDSDILKKNYLDSFLIDSLTFGKGYWMRYKDGYLFRAKIHNDGIDIKTGIHKGAGTDTYNAKIDTVKNEGTIEIYGYD